MMFVTKRPLIKRAAAIKAYTIAIKPLLLISDIANTPATDGNITILENLANDLHGPAPYRVLRLVTKNISKMHENRAMIDCLRY